MRFLRVTMTSILCALAVGLHGNAHAASCSRAVVFTLPTTTWADVARYRPPNLLQLVEKGAAGSVSVRTPTQPTAPGSGFATLGAGAGVVVGPAWRLPRRGLESRRLFQRDVQVPGLPAMRGTLERIGYGSVDPGALGSALGARQLVAIGNADLQWPPIDEAHPGRWTLLAAMDRRGRVDLAATGPRLLTARRGRVSTDPRVIRSAVDVTFERGCASLVIDHGDLHRVDHLATSVGRDLPRRRSQALLAADDLLGHVASKLDLDRDLLLVVSPTSPSRDRPEHLGVAVAVGGNFASGSAMTSATTQRPALVSLTGVAPTVLEHLGLRRPASMLGRPWFAGGSTTPNRISAAVELDAESRFTEANRGRAAAAFFLWVTSVLGVALLARSRSRRAASASSVGPWIAGAVLSLVAFPVTTYLMGLLPQHALGTVGFALAFACVNSTLVAVALLATRQSLTRLFLIVGTSWTVLMLDVLFGARLQLNTLWGYNPVGAGRFYGVGNVAYAVLAASALVTATLVVRRSTAPGRSLLLATGVLASTVIVDSAPMLGADVGGFLSLIPGFILAWMLLAGRRIAVRQVLGVLVALVLLAAAFLAWDLSRPPETQTHLARLYDSVRGAGLEVLWNTIARKLATNVKVLRSTVWPYTFAVAASVVAWALVPPGRRRRLRSQEPQVYAGLLGGVLVALLGFLINDSGIVIPAVMMPFLASLILLLPRHQEALHPVGASS